MRCVRSAVAVLMVFAATGSACTGASPSVNGTRPQSIPVSSKEEKPCIPRTGQPSCSYREDPSGRTGKLIVLIHGVLGGAATTWGDPAKETFWPALIAADGRFVDFDIYLVNYLTPLLHTAPDIYDSSGSELSMLENRGLFSRYSEIHFIAHSMGGLIAKNMLTRLRTRSEKNKLDRVTSVVFLATPSQGSFPSRRRASGSARTRSSEGWNQRA